MTEKATVDLLDEFFNQVIHGDFLADNPDDLKLALAAREKVRVLIGPEGFADEYRRLREIEHRAWHLLDDAMSEDKPDGEVVTIDATGNVDLAVLHELLPEDHPDVSWREISTTLPAPAVSVEFKNYVAAMFGMTGWALSGGNREMSLQMVHEIVQGALDHFRPSPESRSVPDDIRAAGWSVAVHNDYRLNGETHTFWLFTKGSRALKGEGGTDAEALNEVRAQLSQVAE
jgi:hypothetical protein